MSALETSTFEPAEPVDRRIRQAYGVLPARAVYRNEVAQLCDAVPELLAEKPPYEALRAWTRLFLDYVTAKFGMADALRAIAAAGNNPYGHIRDMIQTVTLDGLKARP